MSKKKNPLFEVLDDITRHKRGDKVEEVSSNAVSQYMLLRFLSMDASLLSVVSFLNKYQGLLTDVQMYRLLLAIIPKYRQKKYFKYIRRFHAKDDKLIELLAKHLRISNSKAREYMDLLSTAKKEEIRQWFGGKID